MAIVTVRFWAAARAAAGVAEETGEADDLAGLLDDLRERHGTSLGRVLDRCSFLVDEAPVGTRRHRSVILADNATVEVLPPFAGGSA